MKNEQILKKAIIKAEKNGFDITLVGDIQPYEDYRVYEHIIFSHDFAKAIWGEEEICAYQKWCPAWKHRLEEMVIEKEPLKYLEKWI